MRFLVDENIPSKFRRFVISLGHDMTAQPASTPDLAILKIARDEDRIILTLDKDFEILCLRSPADALIIRIHPPYADALIRAFQKLITETRIENLRGLNLLTESGLIRLPA